MMRQYYVFEEHEDSISMLTDGVKGLRTVAKRFYFKSKKPLCSSSRRGDEWVGHLSGLEHKDSSFTKEGNLTSVRHLTRQIRMKNGK